MRLLWAVGRGAVRWRAVCGSDVVSRRAVASSRVRLPVASRRPQRTCCNVWCERQPDCASWDFDLHLLNRVDRMRSGLRAIPR